MPSPKIISPAVVVRFARGFYKTFFDVLGREFDRWWRDMVAAWPNPAFMAVTTLGAITNLPLLPFYTAIENLGRSLLPNAEYYRRFVVTGYDAFKLHTEISARVFAKVSLIDNTLVEMLISWLATRIFTMLTGGGWIARLRILMGLKTYEDVLAMLTNSTLKAVWFQAVRIGLGLWAASAAFQNMAITALYWDEWFAGLRQTNPKVWSDKRHRDRRKPGKANSQSNLASRRIRSRKPILERLTATT